MNETVPPNRREGPALLRRRVLLATLCLIVVPLLLSGIDQLVDQVATAPSRHLLFPSGSRIEHESCEFRVDVAISQAGLRDRDFPAIPDPEITRIVAVGDSFTFGWGVPLQDAWPKVLERELNRGASSANEVINFGFPGASPVDYTWMTEIAIEHFHPDLLLIGTLQGDDLIQLVEQEAPERAWTTRFGQAAFPTLTGWLQPEPGPMESYRNVFLKSQAFFRSTMTPGQQQKYEALPDTVRRCFENGLLNPSLLQTAIQQPDRFARPVTGKHQWRDQARREWIDCLGTLHDLCQREGVRLVVAIVPDGPYVSAAAAEGMSQLGYHIPAELLTTRIPDMIISEACGARQVRCLSATTAFRQADAGDYFPLDGHFTSRGHRRLAKELAPHLLLTTDVPRRSPTTTGLPAPQQPVRTEGPTGDSSL